MDIYNNLSIVRLCIYMNNTLNYKLINSCLATSIFCYFLAVVPKPVQAIVTVDDPNNHLVPTGDYSGVVSLDFFGNQGCTGTLLFSGKHILTAAHCVSIANAIGLNFLTDVDIVFDLPAGQIVSKINTIYIPLTWDVSTFTGEDIAILRLVQEAPTAAERYDIYRDTDEVGKIATTVGYGNFGQGDTGEIDNSRGQKKLFGKNKFDALDGSLNLPISPVNSRLIVDFDNGNPTHDTLGTIFGINDLGLSTDEVNTARGDSGSPWFLDNRIAAISSSGLS
jgi:secreted trypsin-like serine protease